MKKTTIFLYSLFAILFFAQSCQQSVQSNSENIYDIELERGQKWTVVKPMLAYIRQMETDINNHDMTTSHLLLSDKLDKSLNQLTSNCTMKGKAHDELHKWLLPYIDLLDNLKKSNTKDSDKNIQALKTSFKSFNQYFK